MLKNIDPLKVIYDIQLFYNTHAALLVYYLTLLVFHNLPYICIYP